MKTSTLFAIKILSSLSVNVFVQILIYILYFVAKTETRIPSIIVILESWADSPKKSHSFMNWQKRKLAGVSFF